jgi:Fe-S cluster assembly protein SufD
VKLLFHYIDLDEPTTTFSETQANLAEQAELYHHEIQAEISMHCSNLYVNQAAHSVFSSYELLAPAQLARREVQINLQGAEAKVKLQGAMLAQAEAHAEQHVRIEHQAPHTNSLQNIRGLADDHGQLILRSRLKINEQAPYSDASQQSKHLLLSQHATVQTDPQLEIFVDEVSCQHGTSVGDIDREALFYLQTRGLNEQEAKNTLLLAFLWQIFLPIADPAIQKILQEKLSRLLGVTVKEFTHVSS